MRKWTIIMIIIAVMCIAAIVYALNYYSQKIPSEEGSIQAFFCPQEACSQKLLDAIQHANTIHCAFFDIDIPEIISALEEKNAQVIIDADNNAELSFNTDTRSAYMHDKFCIFDNKIVFTGSMNPTIHDTHENNNNILVIESAYLAKNYEDEFQQMWKGNFGRDSAVKHPLLIVNNTLIENYFCPEDDCEEHIAKALESAHNSIYFMQFSFTSDVLGNILLEKSTTIEIKGIFEKSQNSQYSEYEKLQQFSVLDTSSGLLHHKVFIIDNETVITGSMNPSKNGNENNDENVLIIHNTEIAQLYVDEFEKLK